MSHDNNPHPCKWCQQQPIYAPLEEVNEYGIKVFFCHTCQAEYLYYTRSTNFQITNYASVSLYTTVHDKMYRWTVGPYNPMEAKLWWIKVPGVPGESVNREMKVIMSYQGDPSIINPHNIQDKIKIWLPFI